MTKTIRVAPQNSIVAIMDSSQEGELPKKLGRPRLAATGSCILLGTMLEADGETEIVFTDTEAVSQSEGEPVFDGFIDTPTGRVGLFSVLWEKLGELRVSAGSTRVRVWTNHAVEPDHIVVVLGGERMDS